MKPKKVRVDELWPGDVIVPGPRALLILDIFDSSDIKSRDDKSYLDVECSDGEIILTIMLFKDAMINVVSK